jgi:hypothetical protein
VAVSAGGTDVGVAGSAVSVGVGGTAVGRGGSGVVVGGLTATAVGSTVGDEVLQAFKPIPTTPNITNQINVLTIRIFIADLLWPKNEMVRRRNGEAGQKPAIPNLNRFQKS